MQKFAGQILNQFGQPIASSSVTVYLKGTASLATIYSTDSTASSTPNPTAADSVGKFFFYASDSRLDIQISGATISTTLFTDVEVSDQLGTVSSLDTVHKIYNVQVNIIDFPQMAEPAASDVNGGRIFFDQGVRKFKVSEAGGAFQTLSTGAGSPHTILSATHTDSLSASPVLGDVIHGNATPAWARLAGNITATKKFLAQTGNGAISAAPVWDTIIAGDLPSHNHSAADVTSGTLVEARGGTNQSTYTLGDVLYASAANTLSKLAGNITTTKKFLNQTGNGAVSAAPTWNAIATADLGTGAADATTFLRGDSTWKPAINPFVDLDTGAVTVANTVSESSMQVWSLAASETDVVNRVYRVRNFGVYSTTGTPTLSFKYSVAGITTLGTSVTFTTPNAASGLFWESEMLLIRITTGAAGTTRCHITFKLNGNTVGAGQMEMSQANSNTWDATVTQAIQLRVTWGTASASNTITSRYYSVERLNN